MGLLFPRTRIRTSISSVIADFDELREQKYKSEKEDPGPDFFIFLSVPGVGQSSRARNRR